MGKKTGTINLRTIACGLLACLFYISNPLAAPAHTTEPHVGKHDGEVAPSLPAVDTPSDVSAETMVDWSFPAHLVQTQDWSSAVSAYQELAWKVNGDGKLEALRQVGYAQEELGSLNAAYQTYQNILSLPSVQASPSLVLEFSAKAYALNILRPQNVSSSTLPVPSLLLADTLTPSNGHINPWTAWAIQTAAWHTLTLQKNLDDTYGLENLNDLKKSVSTWQRNQKSLEQRTAMFETLPGLGLLMLGDKRAALGTFTLWFVVLAGVFGSTKNNHTFNALILFGVLGIIMVSAPTLAAQRAAQLSDLEWPNRLKYWQNNFPNPRPTEAAPRHISWLPDVPNSTNTTPELPQVLPAAGPQ